MDLLLFEMSSKIFLGVKSSESGFEEWREKNWSYGVWGTRVILEQQKRFLERGSHDSWRNVWFRFWL